MATPGGAPITARELNRATLARHGLLEPMSARGACVAVERIGSLQARADRLALEAEAERMLAIASPSV